MPGNIGEFLQVAFKMLIAFNVVKAEISIVIDRVVIMHHNSTRRERSKDK